LALVSPPPRFCEEHLQLWDDAGFARAEAAKQSHKSVLVPESTCGSWPLNAGRRRAILALLAGGAQRAVVDRRRERATM
jgi:hypothetical protein